MTDQLYHIKRIITDKVHDATGALQTVDILGTYTSLATAKTAAKQALLEEGLNREFFTQYEVRGEQGEGKEWTHGDGVFVYALTPSGSTMTIALETTPNTLPLPKTPPPEADYAEQITVPLFYVLQTTIHYNLDRSGAIRDTHIEGTYTTFDDAKKQATTCLLDEDVQKENFLEYDEYMGQEDWAFGEETMVHAVGIGGENYLVAVRRRHEK